MTLVFACVLLFVLAPPAFGADDSKVKAATKEVESGDKKIGAGKGGHGVEETAKGIGKTIVEGAKFTGATIKESGEKAGEKAKEASEAAEPKAKSAWARSEEHTSELQSPCNLVCRLLLEKKKKNIRRNISVTC